jgi:hypothetical protein
MTNSKPTPNQSQIRSSDITPPPELVQQWARTFYETATAPGDWAIATATQAARWGADQELEACCALMDDWGLEESDLRAARRPKPPSLKEQALEALDRMDQLPTFQDMDIIRRALEALPE